MAQNKIVRILPAAADALLVEYASLQAAMAHYAALTAANLPGVLELMPAARTVLVRFAQHTRAAQELAVAIRKVPAKTRQAESGNTVELEVVYNGEDLAPLAQLLGVSTQQLIEKHTAASWQAAFAGFAPGFVYCVCEDEFFQVPRLDTPRKRIPAGSVALAGEFSAVYPAASPGGWQLLGQTTAKMWNIDRTQPALVLPGDTVRYRAVRENVQAASSVQHAEKLAVQECASAHTAVPWSSGKNSKNAKNNAASSLAGVGAPAVFAVLQAGVQLSLQDLGRPGLLHMGVGAAGAADKQLLRLANAAVGNCPAAAALEVAGGGTQLQVLQPAVLAWAGAPDLTLLKAAASQREADATGEESVQEVSLAPLEISVQPGRPFAVSPGDVLKIAALSRGLRGYLAVRGGFAGAKVLGSLATDTLSRVGPAVLQAGDLLSVSACKNLEPVRDNTFAMPELLQHGATVVFNVTLGPRADWFSPAAIKAFTTQKWLVTSAADRVGVRLQGDVPLARSVSAELPSEAAVTGAIQVPASGQPVLFLPDHPITGGYPIIGAVVPQQRTLLGQLAPGMFVRFNPVAEFFEL